MAKLSEKPGPRELDLDLNRMRADKISEIRTLIKELDDLDAVERVLNRQTATIALHAATHSNGNGKQSRAAKALAKAQRLLLAAAPDVEEHLEEHEPRHRLKKRRKKGVRAPVLMDQILVVLGRKGVPVQASELMAGLRDAFKGPLPTGSTFSRALMLLRKDRKIAMEQAGPNHQYPRYSLLGISGAAAPRRKSASKHRAAIRRVSAMRVSPLKRQPNATRENAFSMSRAVLHALVDGDPRGMSIPQVTAVLEKDPNAKWLDGYTHNTQVSWNIKGHRDKGRVKTITQRDGTRIHKALRPAISVRKG